MNLYLPNNFYSRLLAESLSSEKKIKIYYFPSAILSSKLNEDNNGVALIPSLDLLNNKEFFVSSKFGVSFEGSLSNSYFYFTKKGDINNLSLIGDISSTEVILSKIIFKEEYELDVNIEISKDQKIENKNKLIVGDENFNSVNLNFALSLTEKITDIFDYPLPFVNYILASNNKELLKTFNIKAEEIQNRIIKLIDKSETIKSINTNSKKFILNNVPSLIYNYDEQDKEGLVELIKLPYFHAIVKDIIEIKFE